MSIQLVLPPALEERLREEAAKQGLSPDAMTVQILEKHFPPTDRRERLLSLLKSWMEEDETEQRDTWKLLVQALDEDRPAERKLFPEELKGVSW